MLYSYNRFSDVVPPKNKYNFVDDLFACLGGYVCSSWLEPGTARVRKPRDKASAESSVNTIYRQIYALIRHETAQIIEDLNKKIAPLLQRLNHQKMQRSDQSRYEQFVSSEKTMLKPFPASDFVVLHQTEAKIQMNYHVMLGEDQHSLVNNFFFQ